MFILLPLSEKGLPKNIQEKKDIIHTIVDAALEEGLSRDDIVVDGLAATVGANKMAAVEIMETISYCKNELGLATVCGLSSMSIVPLWQWRFSQGLRWRLRIRRRIF